MSAVFAISSAHKSQCKSHAFKTKNRNKTLNCVGECKIWVWAAPRQKRVPAGGRLENVVQTPPNQVGTRGLLWGAAGSSAFTQNKHI